MTNIELIRELIKLPLDQEVAIESRHLDQPLEYVTHCYSFASRIMIRRNKERS